MNTLREIIDVVERILCLERTIAEKETAVTQGRAEMDAEVGYKKTIARCRLQEAEGALSAAIAEHSELSASIPAPDELLYAQTMRHIATLRLKRGDLNEGIDAQRRILDAEEEKLRSGPWRPKGTPLPPVILKIKAKIADIEVAIARINVDMAGMMKNIDAEEARLADARGFTTWLADETCEAPLPACVVKRIKASHDEIMATATRLEILTPAVIARRAEDARQRAAEEARFASEEAEWAAEETRWHERAAKDVAREKALYRRLIAINKKARLNVAEVA
jgi:hypothetical protein